MVDATSIAMSFRSKPMRPREGLGFFRFLMVLGSMAPLFIFLAIRGVPIIDSKPLFSDTIYCILCLLVVALPAFVLAIRIWIAGRNKDTKELVVGNATDHRDHLIAYLFAVVIPLYQNNYTTLRDVLAAFAVLCFILFLFVYMNLHYMNLVFALAGYRVYTVETEDKTNPFSGRRSFILITKRYSLHSQQKINARRISDTVFIEYE